MDKLTFLGVGLPVLLLLAVCFILLILCSVLLGRNRRYFEKTVRLNEELEESKRHLAQTEKLLLIQQERERELNLKIEQARRDRHDLRHHLAALQTYLQAGEGSPALDYLLELEPGIVTDQTLTYCANSAADAVIQHYLSRAGELELMPDVATTLSAVPGVSDLDLCSILGNCLENAMEAQEKVPKEERFLRIRIRQTEGWVSIAVGNRTAEDLEEGPQGYLSTKEENRVGVGLSSIRQTAEKYGGTARFEVKEGTFFTSVVLFVPDTGVKNHEGNAVYQPA